MSMRNTALSLAAEAVRRARAGLRTAPPRFDLEPGVGVGPVVLHTTLDEVLDALDALPAAASGHTRVTYADQLRGVVDDPPDGSLATFFDGALRIDLDGSDRVRHIDTALSPHFEVWFDDVRVFDTPAPALFGHFASLEPHPEALRYAPAGFVFPATGVTLHDAHPRHDALGDGARAIYARVGVGTPASVAMAAG